MVDRVVDGLVGEFVGVSEAGYSGVGYSGVGYSGMGDLGGVSVSCSG